MDKKGTSDSKGGRSITSPSSSADGTASSSAPASSGTAAAAFGALGAANSQRAVREYRLGEEIANSVSHGVGALLAIAAIVLCVVAAVRDGGGVLLASALIYTITMTLEYTMSTLYHALTGERAKRVFKVLDHSCIYLYIAGSYTPFCLVALADAGGLWLCIFVWAVAVVGVACEAFWVFRPRWVSVLLYLLMGWSVIWFLPGLLVWLPTPGLWLLIAGGLCYTVGCVFYVLKKIPYMHSVFHLWVLAGSICQFFAILLYVL
jgi:hemolysin III